MVEMLIEQ